MKCSIFLLSILPVALAVPIAEPETVPQAELEARQQGYAKYGDQNGGYATYTKYDPPPPPPPAYASYGNKEGGYGTYGTYGTYKRVAGKVQDAE